MYRDNVRHLNKVSDLESIRQAPTPFYSGWSKKKTTKKKNVAGQSASSLGPFALRFGSK